MPDPTAQTPSARDVRVAEWRGRLMWFVFVAIVDAAVIFGAPLVLATNFNFDIPVIDTSTGQDVGISYEQFIDQTREQVGWWVAAANAILVLWVWTRRRERTQQ